ncbi:MAG: hypothetical protein JO214_09810 [Frankiaceae bacterium]|nr:hypothetical protein [Frankiaceae bacterium]
MAPKQQPIARAVSCAGLVGTILLAPSTSASGQPYNRCGPQADSYAPTVSSVTISTTTLSIAKHAQQQTVTVHASDPALSDNSGVRVVEVQLEGPRDSLAMHLALTDGTTTEGTWTGTFTIPTTANSGDWNIRLVGVRDRTYNWTYYIRDGKQPHSRTDPRLQSGWSTEFTVTGTPGQPSFHPGKLASGHLAHHVVDARRAPAAQAVSVRFRGPQPAIARLWLRGHGTGRRYFAKPRLRPRSDGSWHRHFTIPRWTGSLRVRVGLYVRYPDDVRPNYHFFAPSASRTSQLPGGFRIRGRADLTPPTLTDFTFTPDAVDSTSESQTVTVTARATDHQSGVSRIYVDFFHHPRRYPPRGYGSGVALTHDSDGTWHGAMTVPMCIGSHHWQADVYLFDNAGGRSHDTLNELRAAGFPTKLTVTSDPPGDTEPPYVTASSSSGLDKTITLNFSEGVKGPSPDTLAVYDAPKHSAATPVTVTMVTCSNGVATVECDGSQGLVTAASLTVPDLTAHHRYDVYANPNPTVARITDGVGNPMGADGRVAEVTV